MRRYALAVAVVALGVVIVIASGPRALVVYGFFVVLAFLVAFATRGWGEIFHRSGERWSSDDRR